MEQYIILITAISLTINFISLFVWYVNREPKEKKHLPDVPKWETIETQNWTVLPKEYVDEINNFNKLAMNNPLVLK